jgi:predicted nucleic acid-binding protein
VEVKIALDTNDYSDFMRGHADRVERIRAAREIFMPLIVLAELRAGFAASNQESTNRGNLQRFLNSERVSVLLPDDQTTHHYSQLYVILRDKGAAIPPTICGLRRWWYSTVSFCARLTPISRICRLW